VRVYDALTHCGKGHREVNVGVKREETRQWLAVKHAEAHGGWMRDGYACVMDSALAGVHAE